MSNRPIRVLVGSVETGGLTFDFADGFRQLGHQVTTVSAWLHRFHPEAIYDYDISVTARDLIHWPQWVRRSASPIIQFPRGAANRAARYAQLLKLITAHDLFVFKWGGVGLTPGNREFPMLKALGKTVVSAFMGSDVRDLGAYNQQYDSLSHSPEFDRELSGRSREDITNPYGPLENIRTAELYSDLILSQPNQSGLAVRPYKHLFLPMRLSLYKARIPGREVPVVVHAPSHAGVKGSGPILQALELLRHEGVRFELRLLENLTNRQVVDQLSDADVLIDQLYFPYHGKLTVEGMASGCAVTTCNREDYEPYPAGRPICHIDAGSIAAPLRRLLTNRELRLRLAHEGRQYALARHDHVSVVKDILGALSDDPVRCCDHFPTFFATSFRPAAGSVSVAERKLTERAILKWGLPDGADLDDLLERGLVTHRLPKLGSRIARWTIPSESARRLVAHAVSRHVYVQ